MSYIISVSGHTTSEENEKKILDAFKKAVKDTAECNETGTTAYARATATQFHGVVDLNE